MYPKHHIYLLIIIPALILSGCIQSLPLIYYPQKPDNAEDTKKIIERVLSEQPIEYGAHNIEVNDEFFTYTQNIVESDSEGMTTVQTKHIAYYDNIKTFRYYYRDKKYYVKIYDRTGHMRMRICSFEKKKIESIIDAISYFSELEVR